MDGIGGVQENMVLFNDTQEYGLLGGAGCTVWKQQG